MAATNKKSVVFVRVEGLLAERLEHQCKRLGVNKTAFSTMALTKLIEEEEQIEANKLKRS